jgi:hypothetical protein
MKDRGVVWIGNPEAIGDDFTKASAVALLGTNDFQPEGVSEREETHPALAAARSVKGCTRR